MHDKLTSPSEYEIGCHLIKSYEARITKKIPLSFWNQKKKNDMFVYAGSNITLHCKLQITSFICNYCFVIKK